jgi:hypothetical protein
VCRRGPLKLTSRQPSAKRRRRTTPTCEHKQLHLHLWCAEGAHPCLRAEASPSSYPSLGPMTIPHTAASCPTITPQAHHCLRGSQSSQ